MEVTAKEGGVSFWGNENVLKLMVMAVHACKFTENHYIVHFKCTHSSTHATLLEVSTCGRRAAGQAGCVEIGRLGRGWAGGCLWW